MHKMACYEEKLIQIKEVKKQMRIKSKNGLKVAAITIALLLCLAFAVGITGAWYQAKRQATGTLSMDQGIIIDYKGFDKTPDEGIWTRETTTTFLLFNETNAQPGQNIPVNAAGIRANEKSVNFYARVKLSYKFYNNGTEVTTLSNASDLITRSANFFSTNWVDGGGADGYYYYATGTTLNKFEKGAAATTPFVELFATDAKFIIEGAGFTGANNNGEGGGFKIDETTSINKIEVYLTLETLQGDADADAEGWKITKPVIFAEATGKMETSVKKESTTEDLNVSVAGATEVPINEVVFPYDTDTTLKFNSNNVEYVTLTYSNGESETFDAATYEVAENTFKLNAKSSKGTVTGYTVGLFSDSEYTGIFYKMSSDNQYIIVNGYMGDMDTISVLENVKVKERTGKLVFKYDNREGFFNAINPKIEYLEAIMPFSISGYDKEITNAEEYNEWLMSLESISDAEFLSTYGKEIVLTFKGLFEASGWTKKYDIKEIGDNALSGNINLKNVTLTEQITRIGKYAFGACVNLESFVIPNSVTEIGKGMLGGCDNLKSISIGTGLTYLSEGCISGCMTSIVIPANITEIRKEALNLPNLTEITVKATTPPILGNSALTDYNKISQITAIYVPAESVEAYKTNANWAAYADKIQAIA